MRLKGNIAIQMACQEAGKPELWSLTVNLGGLRGKDCTFIDINNNRNEILE